MTASSWTTLLSALLLTVALSSPAAQAQRAQTSEALDRLAEALAPALEGGALSGSSPMIIVSARPAFEETRSWYPTAAVVALADAVGRANLRACEACMQPRVYSSEGRLQYSSGALTLEEIVAIDTNTRGKGAPARTAAWVDETDDGVAVRIASLATGEILFAQNFDGGLREEKRSGEVFNFTSDVQRRLRGEALTHIFIDAALYPGQHFSLDVVDQFGSRNLDLAGITLSLTDPVLGVGAAYYRVIPEAFNLTVGVQGLVSIPTAAANALGADGEVIDPLLTGVLVVRWPIPYTSFGALAMVSTNGTIGVGVTLMNFTILPILP